MGDHRHGQGPATRPSLGVDLTRSPQHQRRGRQDSFVGDAGLPGYQRRPRHSFPCVPPLPSETLPGLLFLSPRSAIRQMPCFSPATV